MQQAKLVQFGVQGVKRPRCASGVDQNDEDKDSDDDECDVENCTDDDDNSGWTSLSVSQYYYICT